MDDREDLVYQAKLAEQAERYDGELGGHRGSGYLGPSAAAHRGRELETKWRPRLGAWPGDVDSGRREQPVGPWERGRRPGPQKWAPPASSGAGTRQPGGRGGEGGVGCKMAAGGRASPGAGEGGGDGWRRLREGSGRRGPLWGVESHGLGRRVKRRRHLGRGKSGEREPSAGASPGNMAGGGGGFSPVGPVWGGGRGGSQRRTGWGAGRGLLRAWGGGQPRTRAGEGRRGGISAVHPWAEARRGAALGFLLRAPAHLGTKRLRGSGVRWAGGGRGLVGAAPPTPRVGSRRPRSGSLSRASPRKLGVAAMLPCPPGGGKRFPGKREPAGRPVSAWRRLPSSGWRLRN